MDLINTEKYASVDKENSVQIVYYNKLVFFLILITKTKISNNRVY